MRRSRAHARKRKRLTERQRGISRTFVESLEPRQSGGNPVQRDRPVAPLVPVRPAAGHRGDVRQRRRGPSVPAPPAPRAAAAPAPPPQVLRGLPLRVVVPALPLPLHRLGELQQLIQGLPVHVVGGDGDEGRPDQGRHGQVHSVSIHFPFSRSTCLPLVPLVPLLHRRRARRNPPIPARLGEAATGDGELLERKRMLGEQRARPVVNFQYRLACCGIYSLKREREDIFSLPIKLRLFSLPVISFFSSFLICHFFQYLILFKLISPPVIFSISVPGPP